MQKYPVTASRGNNSPAQIRRRAVPDPLTGAPSGLRRLQRAPSAATRRATTAADVGHVAPNWDAPARPASSRRTRSPRRAWADLEAVPAKEKPRHKQKKATRRNLARPQKRPGYDGAMSVYHQQIRAAAALRRLWFKKPSCLAKSCARRDEGCYFVKSQETRGTPCVLTWVSRRGTSRRGRWCGKMAL